MCACVCVCEARARRQTFLSLDLQRQRPSSAHLQTQRHTRRVQRLDLWGESGQMCLHVGILCSQVMNGHTSAVLWSWQPLLFSLHLSIHPLIKACVRLCAWSWVPALFLHICKYTQMQIKSSVCKCCENDAAFRQLPVYLSPFLSASCVHMC